MAFAFFQLPANAGPELAAPLNSFLGTHRVVRVTREWCPAGTDSYWAFCVEYMEGAPAAGTVTTKVDYKAVLPPEQFEVFARLRTLRKALAEREGQPVFAVFSNQQLADIVRRDCRTLDDLKGVPGIGESRVEKYGTEVLAVLQENGTGA